VDAPKVTARECLGASALKQRDISSTILDVMTWRWPGSARIGARLRYVLSWRAEPTAQEDTPRLAAMRSRPKLERSAELVDHSS
jgi:hypothetical protein